MTDHEPDPLVTDNDPHIAAALNAVDTALDLLDRLAAARHTNGVTDADLHAAGLDDEAIAEIESGSGDLRYLDVAKYAATVGFGGANVQKRRGLDRS